MDSMATTQDIFHRAPESAAAIRRRLRAERKGVAGRNDADMLTQDSSIIVDQVVGDKSRYSYKSGIYIVLTYIIQLCRAGSYTREKRTKQ